MKNQTKEVVNERAVESKGKSGAETPHSKASGGERNPLSGRVWTLEVPRERIVPSSTNPRKEFPKEMIEERAGSLKKQGQLVALIVRPMINGKVTVYAGLDEEEMTLLVADPKTKFEIADGECRWRAAKVAGLESLKCDVRFLSDEEFTEIQWTSWMQRKELSPLEEAMGLAALRKQGWSIEKLEERFGVKKSSIFNALKLSRLEGGVRAALEAGAISPSVAAIVATVPGKAGQEQFLKELKRYGENLSVRSAKEELERSMLRPLGKASWDLKEEKIWKDCCACEVCPKNTRNMGAIDPELVKGPARCTDLSCYGGKEGVMGERLAAQAKKDGVEYWPRAKWRQAQYTAAVQGLKWENDRAYEVVGYDEDTTWGEWLKKKKVEVKPSLVAETDDGVQKAWTRAVLEEAGVLKKEPKRKPDAYQVKHRQDAEILKGVKERVQGLLLEKLNGEKVGQAEGVGRIGSLLRALAFEEEPWDSKRKIGELKLPEAVETLAKGLVGNSWYNLSEPPGGLELFGIDVKKVAAGVKAEMAARKKHKGQKPNDKGMTKKKKGGK